MSATAVKKRLTEQPQTMSVASARKAPGSDRVIAILLSVLVHGLIVAALLWGWWRYRPPPPSQATLAIQAGVVHATPQDRVDTPASIQLPAQQTLMDQERAATLAAQKAAAEKAAEQKAAAEAAAQAAAQQAAQHAAAEQAATEQAAAARQAVQKAAQEQAQREAADAAATAAEEKQVREQIRLAAERKAKQEADAKAHAEAVRETQAMAQQMKVEQAERAREADLKNQMQAEEKLDALESGPAEQEYKNSIIARITRAWVRPASAQPGVTCSVSLTQIPGGEVTHVTVQGCNGDEAVRQSVQTAVYKASPLPTPPDPALFDPNITVTFAPDQ
jgi:colicin import membrane protein